ncbi:MAG TPA: preprotein translocase subunit SecA, partial [Humisphaera sp.]
MAITIQKLLVKVFGSRNDRLLKRYWKFVEQIKSHEDKVRKMTDEQLRARTLELHVGLAGDPVKRIKPTLRPDDVRPEALAILREAMDRNIGMRTVFSPEENEMGVKFDPDRLKPDARKMYDEVVAQIAAFQPAVPTVGGSAVGGGMFEFLQQHALAAAAANDAWRRVPVPVELYAAIRELYPESRPPFRARPFDVQMIGGMVLYEGKIAEMATGEGKTFVAPLACFLRVLEGFHCHVVTVNDYLVRRDATWIKPAFNALGLSVGYIQSSMDAGGEDRRAAYECDVTYGTNSEFGFDYLRDNMKGSAAEQVQGPLDFVLVDEVDSILIDEARTPLIISGSAADNAAEYRAADEVARKIIELHKPYAEIEKKEANLKRIVRANDADLEKAKSKEEKEAVRKRTEQAEKDLAELEKKKEGVTQYYEVEWDRKSAHLTHDGIRKAQEIANVGSFYVGNNVHWPHLMEQAMRAHVVYERDKDYVVERGKRSGEVEVIIVDENTGRKMEGRQWSDGLHQAVEAKERVQIKKDTQTVATITIQNFCKLYRALSGMTGTAQTEAEEFMKIYKLEVVTIPTNRPVIRRDREDRVYRREAEKWAAIIEEIKTYSDAGRPVLVGTTSVEKSEKLSEMLTRKYGIQHEVLNAKQHERESHIVALAGQTHEDPHGKRVGNVTIATNMAGRGTDIKLAPEVVWEVTEKPAHGAAAGTYKIRNRSTGEEQTVEVTGNEEDENPLADVFQVTPDAKLVGGLHVIGTERHSARRIDNQLRGRSGRQGDPGSSRFYVSLEDELMRVFAGDWTIKMLGWLGMEEGMHIEDKRITKGIQRAQKKVEERHYLGRKNMLDYDEVMDYQRGTFYGTRQDVLEGRGLDRIIHQMIGDSVRDAVEKDLVKDRVAATIAEWAKGKFRVSIDPADIAGRRHAEWLEGYIREQARVQVEEELQSTLYEFLGEDDEDRSGWDTAGLSGWAMSRFKVNLPQSRIRKMELADLEELLRQEAKAQIEGWDLSELQQYLQPLYAQKQLAEWAQDKFGVTIDPKEMVLDGERGMNPKDPDEVTRLLEERARQVYARREVEYPIDKVIVRVMQGGRRLENPEAARAVVGWARAKYGLFLPVDDVLGAAAEELRAKLIALQEQALNGGGIEKDVDALVAAEGGKRPTAE